MSETTRTLVYTLALILITTIGEHLRAQHTHSHDATATLSEPHVEALVERVPPRGTRR